MFQSLEPHTMPRPEPIPVVLTLSGNDPSGGAGLQADLEALASQGCHAAPVVTALTVQDTHDVYRVQPVATDLILEQARCILADLPVVAIKLGLIPSAALALALGEIVAPFPGPVVLDPVLRASGGGELVTTDLLAALRDLLPHIDLLTPNASEARRLWGHSQDLDACGQGLLEMGCGQVLITGADEDHPEVINHFYRPSHPPETYTWPRLPDRYHGSGCTLASSIAGQLARGLEPANAVHHAQEYTWQTLRYAYSLTDGQKIPNRLYWAASHV